MACLDNIIEINKSDCIGNSRETINTNFTVLKDKVCSLETKTTIIEEKSIYYVPLYGIIMYYGDITLGGTDFELNGYGKATKKLDAFAICDGSNGTPDMRDRFVVGAGRSYTHKTFGPQVPGQEPSETNDTLSLQFSSVKLDVTEMPTHNHGYTEPNGGQGHSHPGTALSEWTGGTSAHKHDLKHGTELGTIRTRDEEGGNSADGNFLSNQQGGDSEKRLSVEDSDNSKHSHALSINRSTTGITISDKGGSVKHENRPPYIALGYIMRVK
jgi:hypothetical protein